MQFVLLTGIVIGVTLFAHWPVLSAQAMSFDDEEAIIRNHLVQNPGWNSVGRFFSEVTLSSVVRGYYRPLTLTSLMLDWAMGGRPDDFRAFHRTSLALHIGSTVLIVLLVYQVFRRPAVAAMVGLLFGVHPLTVEPIAWVMERKTVLAAFFAFACLNAYLRYTRRLQLGSGWAKWGWYIGAISLYLLSLLAKPTGTPLPIIMLLMDVWPLRRFSRKTFLEKIPFFIVSAIFAALCVLCEQKVNPLSLPATISPLHLPLRLCWLVVFYPCKVLLPIHLSSVYILPDPLALTNGLVLLAVACVVLLVTALVVSRRWTPVLWVGAAMFYIGLAPTMGFVEYSWAVASDKYVYLPAIGPVLILGWLLAGAWCGGTSATRRSRQVATVAVVVGVAGLLTTGTRRYLSHWQKTESLCDYTVALAPNAAPAYNNRAIAYGKMHDYGRVIQDCTKAIELLPGYAEAYNNRGSAHDGRGDYDRAIEDYTKAIELKRDYALAYNNRGIVHGKRHDYERAIQDCTKAIELLPAYAGPYYNRGIALGLKGDYTAAIQDFEKTIELQPDHAEAYSNRGTAFFSMGDYDSAIRDYTKAIELNPGFAETYNKRGVAYVMKRDDARAIRDFSKAIELKPDYAEAYYSRGVANGRNHDYGPAIQDCSRAIELKPDYAAAYYSRGTVFDETGDSARAIRDYSRAIELKPGYAMAYNNRGNTYTKMDDFDRAIADYTMAVQLEPESPLAYINRGTCLREMGQLDRAIQDYTRAIELRADHAMAYYNRGKTYVMQGNFGMAIEDFTGAIKFNPGLVDAYENRASVYCSVKAFDKAWADVSKCRQLGGIPSPELIRKLTQASGRTE